MANESVAQDQLRAFIERIERMEEEKKAIADDIKEIYAEAKGNGFDTKVLRQIVRIRKQDHAERMEQEAILELYMAALGMQARRRGRRSGPRGEVRPRTASLERRGPGIDAERGQRRGDDAGAVEASGGVHVGLARLLGEGVGDHQRAEAQLAVEQAGAGEEGRDVAAEAADAAFFDGQQHLVLAGEPGDQLGVERLHEAGVGDGGREPEGRELLGCCERLAKAGAVGEEGNARALADDAALADLEDRCRVRADRRRDRRRAGSGRRSGRRRRRRRCATMWRSSASSPAAISTMSGTAPR